jgi:hypothetical protein
MFDCQSLFKKCLLFSPPATAKKQGWTSGQFCEFVKDCDVFIFTCHPVQGDVPPLWDFLQHLRDLYDALESKIVFPKREALLEDPVFRQDKAQLHETLKEFMSPSIKIDRPADDFTFDEHTLKIIYEFASKNYETHPKNGLGAWHVKAGFSTAGRGNKKAYTIKEIPRKASQVFRKYGLWSVPYVQVERTYANSVVRRFFNLFMCIYICIYILIFTLHFVGRQGIFFIGPPAREIRRPVYGSSTYTRQR